MKIDQIRDLTKLEQLNLIQALGVFTALDSEGYYADLKRARNEEEYEDCATKSNVAMHFAFTEGTVLSKASYKELANAMGSKNSYTGQNYFSPKKFYAVGYNWALLVEISFKTNKLGKDKLKVILEHRLAGVYKGKYRDGKTWNQGGI